MSSLSKTLEEAIPLSTQTTFNLEFLQRIFREIDARLRPLRDQQADVADAVLALQGVALDRINEVLTPAIESVLVMQERGYTLAHSSTSNTLGVGNVLTFNIADLDERSVFVPSPFIALTREANATDYAIARLYSYDSTNGVLICTVQAVFGNAGPFTDWVIAAVAGSTPAQISLLEDAIDARDAAIAAQNSAEASATTSGAAAILIAGGPVSSVNGRAGSVTLSKSDVGLSNVDNTADADKPISSAVASALTAKADAAATTSALTTKLDTSAYTAADVLAKLLTVDGAGSGIDADTLDGLNSSAFALATGMRMDMIGTPVVVSAPVAQIVFSGLPSDGYVEYVLILEGIVTADSSINQAIRLHVSTDNGATWKTTNGDYGGASNNYLADFQADGATHGSPGNSYTEIRLFGLGKASKRTMALVEINARYTNAPAYNFVSAANNCMRLVAEQDNALRIMSSSGNNITAGRAVLLGIKQS